MKNPMKIVLLMLCFLTSISSFANKTITINGTGGATIHTDGSITYCPTAASSVCATITTSSAVNPGGSGHYNISIGQGIVIYDRYNHFHGPIYIINHINNMTMDHSGNFAVQGNNTNVTSVHSLWDYYNDCFYQIYVIDSRYAIVLKKVFGIIPIKVGRNYFES